MTVTDNIIPFLVPNHEGYIHWYVCTSREVVNVLSFRCALVPIGPVTRRIRIRSWYNFVRTDCEITGNSCYYSRCIIWRSTRLRSEKLSRGQSQMDRGARLDSEKDYTLSHKPHQKLEKECRLQSN